jgi:hypothetical protein
MQLRLKVDPFIWQLDRDYPDGTPNDNTLPISTVYIKTHDGTDWMATYDTNPAAVTGPDAIRNLINVYGQQGIQVAAWFVPTGSDYNTQVQMAEQVIDSGVTALYADVEPFHGRGNGIPDRISDGGCDNGCDGGPNSDSGQNSEHRRPSGERWRRLLGVCVAGARDDDARWLRPGLCVCTQALKDVGANIASASFVSSSLMDKKSYLERETGIEPATLCLGRLRSAIRI